MCFSLTQIITYDYIICMLPRIKTAIEPNALFFLVGTMCDDEARRVLSFDEVSVTECGGT